MRLWFILFTFRQITRASKWGVQIPFLCKGLSQSVISGEKKSPAENHVRSICEDLPLCLTPDSDGNFGWLGAWHRSFFYVLEAKSPGINWSPKMQANKRLEKICLLSTLLLITENPVQVRNRQGSFKWWAEWKSIDPKSLRQTRRCLLVVGKLSTELWKPSVFPNLNLEVKVNGCIFLKVVE